MCDVTVVSCARLVLKRFSNFLSSLKIIDHCTLLGKGEVRLQGKDHDEREEAQDVKEAATQASDVGLIKERADQVTEG